MYRRGVDKKTVPPHLYAVADNAFQEMSGNAKDQVCRSCSCSSGSSISSSSSGSSSIMFPVVVVIVVIMVVMG